MSNENCPPRDQDYKKKKQAALLIKEKNRLHI